MYALELIGGGRMGEALLGGLLAAEAFAPSDVVVVERDAARRSQLEDLFPGITLAEVPLPSSGVILATKPADVPAVLGAAAEVGVERALSIAAGVGLDQLEAAVATEIPIIRAMPNTPSLVGAGAAAIAGGSHAAEADLVWAEGILSAVGTVVRVSEDALDAVTGLSGSGPAYVFLIAEAMTDAGVLAGLPRATAEQLVAQTLLGSARLLSESDQSAAELRAAVTSPGGTTAAGLQVLEQRAVRAAVADAVAAAARRSREMGA